MKTRAVALLLFAAAMMALVGTRREVVAQEIISGNLFQNPGWESGYYNQDNISQIAVPNGWRMHWLDNVAFDGTEGLPAYRPETVVWNIQDAPENERSLFFRDGSYTLKIFKGYAPMYAAVSQEVSGLEVGRKYRIVAPIFVDLVAEYAGGKKVAPWDGSHGFVRFGVGAPGAPWLDASQIHYSPYWTGDSVSPFYLAMPIFVWDFVATQPNMTVFIEVGSRYPHPNNGFFMDGVGLFALDQVDYSVGSGVPSSGGNSGGGNNDGGSAPPAAPAPAPTAVSANVTPRDDGSIVHVVGPGDSFWSIAIKYASVLELSPEAALPHIQELNGNPQFISGGQELLIREAGDYADTPPAEEEAPAEEELPVEEEATEEESADGGRDGVETGEDVIVVEGEPLAPEEPEEEASEAAAPVPPSGVCVAAFNDSNGNGQFDGAPEAYKADAAITLFKDGSTVTTYITDGVTPTYCFEDLEPGTYQVQMYPPANFLPTTADSWAVSVSEGVFIPLEFGMQYDPQGVAELANASATAAAGSVSDSEEPTEPEESAEAAANPEAEEAGGEDNLLSNMGGLILIAAAVLVLVAGAGVFMLRRG